MLLVSLCHVVRYDVNRK